MGKLVNFMHFGLQGNRQYKFLIKIIVIILFKYFVLRKWGFIKMWKSMSDWFQLSQRDKFHLDFKKDRDHTGKSIT